MFKKSLAIAMALCMVLSIGIIQAACADEDQVTIKITWWGGQTRHEYTQQLLDMYTELNPNVTFEASPSGWDGYFDKLATQAASGAMPDIMQMDYLYIATFANNDSIADLSPVIADGYLDVSNLDAKLLQSGVIAGKQVGVPLSSSILAVMYNPEAIAAAGASDPEDGWTWEEYIALNTAVAGKFGEPSALAASNGPVSDTNIFRYWVRQHGGMLFSEDGTSLGFEDDAITAGFFQMWKDMIDLNVAADPDEQAQLASLGLEGSPVVAGKAATSIEWNNGAVRASSINDKLHIAMPPVSTADDYSGLWIKPGMFFSVAETSEVKEEAAKFISWFLNSEEANAVIAGERGVPTSALARESLVSSGTMTAQQIEMFQYVDKAAPVAGGTPLPDPAGVSEVNSAFADAANSVFYGVKTAEEAAVIFREQADGILLRNNAK